MFAVIQEEICCRCIMKESNVSVKVRGIKRKNLCDVGSFFACLLFSSIIVLSIFDEFNSFFSDADVVGSHSAYFLN